MKKDKYKGIPITTETKFDQIQVVIEQPDNSKEQPVVGLYFTTSDTWSSIRFLADVKKRSDAYSLSTITIYTVNCKK